MTKTGRISAIQAVADATGDNNWRISLGEPGSHLENTVGEKKPTGAAWEPEPKSFPIIMEGLAAFEGAARQMTASGPLLETDRRIELGSNNVVVSLPSAESKYTGSYVIKSLGTTGGGVSGTIDGASVTIPIIDWDFLTIYCNGSAWLTG